MILRNKHRSFNFFKKVRDKGLTLAFTVQISTISSVLLIEIFEQHGRPWCRGARSEAPRSKTSVDVVLNSLDKIQSNSSKRSGIRD